MQSGSLYLNKDNGIELTDEIQFYPNHFTNRAIKHPSHYKTWQTYLYENVLCHVKLCYFF